MGKLPNGWASLPLEYSGDWRGGGTPSKSNPDYWTNGSIPWVSPKEMKRDYIGDTKDYITAAAVEDSATQIVPKKSIMIVTRSGILKHSLPVAVATRDVAINQDLKAVTPPPGIEPSYLFYHLKADASKILTASAKEGTTVDSLDFNRLKAYELRIAPLAEQKRIVAKIDRLTTRTKRARTDLDRIPALFSKYRQAMLGAVFEKLEGRHSHIRLADLTTKIGSGATPRGGSAVYVDEGTPLIRSQNVHFARFTVEGLVFIDDEAANALSAVRVQKNDVLLNITGASIGRVCIVPDKFVDARVNQHVSIIRCIDRLMPKFLLYFLWSPHMQKLIDNENYGVTRQALTKGMIENFEVPAPDLEKQQEIVRQIEKNFSWLGRMETNYAAATKLLPELDAAILSKAFSGKLVSQDQDDEPAFKLLHRIKAERETAREKIKRRHSSLPTPTIAKRKQTMANLIEALNSNAGWMSASEAARVFGIGNGSTSDAVEEFYSDLRTRVLEGSIEVERRGDEDWLRLHPSEDG